MTAFPASSPPRLIGKVALVTGAMQSVGGTTVKLSAWYGVRAIVNTPVCDACAETSATETDSSAGNDDNILLVQADIRDRVQTNAVVAAGAKRFGDVGALINSTGVNVFSDPLKLSEGDWACCLSVDLEDAWYYTCAVLPYVLARGVDNIANIASVHGHKIIPGVFPYLVAKHGLTGLTRVLDTEYVACGIRTNSTSPGLILTSTVEVGFAAASDPKVEYHRQVELLLCKCIGEPGEVAHTALFFASDEACFINTIDIPIDGGCSQFYHE